MAFIGILGFLLGVSIRSFFNVSPEGALFLTLLGIGIGIVGALYKKDHLLSISAVVLICIGLGIFRFTTAIPLPSEILLTQVGENVTIEGIIYQEPEERENGMRLSVNVRDTEEGNFEHRIVMTAPFGEEYRYGDRVRIQGRLLQPLPFETDTGRVFAYDTYLEKDGVLFTIGRGQAEVLSRGEGLWLKHMLFSAKQYVIARVNQLVPEPEASLVGGIVFGVEDALGETLLTAFRRSGLIHIVVLSGFNVSIAADWFMSMARFLPEKMRVGSGAIGIVLFAIMTGASATTVRASIMALLALLARSTARRYDIVRALLVAGALMVLHNPYILVFDLSFQLSVLATCGLIFIAPLIEPRLTLIPTIGGARGLAAATIAAQIAVMPLIVYQIGELSLVGVPANILVLPFIPLAMGTGFATGFAGALALPLGVPFALVTHILLLYVISIATFFAQLPGASINVPPFPWWGMLGIYVCITYSVYWVYRKYPHTKEHEGILGRDILKR